MTTKPSRHSTWRRPARAVAAAVVVAALVPAALMAATPRVDASAAARACASSRERGKHLGPRDVAFLRRLVPCVFRAERSQLGLDFTPRASVSRDVDRALKRDVALAYLAHGQPSVARRADVQAFAAVAKRTCRAARASHPKYVFEVGDTMPPPALTAAEVARLLAAMFQQPDSAARARNATFGVAVRQGLLYENGDRRGSAYGIVGVTCAKK